MTIIQRLLTQTRNLIRILSEALQIVDRLRVTDSSMCEELQSNQQHLEHQLYELRTEYKRLLN